MSNWIGPTVKQLWNYAMHLLHNFFGFDTNTTAFCLGRSSLHLLLIKSSIRHHFGVRCFIVLVPVWWVSAIGVSPQPLWVFLGSPESTETLAWWTAKQTSSLENDEKWPKININLFSFHYWSLYKFPWCWVARKTTQYYSKFQSQLEAEVNLAN